MLTSFVGLDSIVGIDGILDINHNQNLTNFLGLERLGFVRYLKIYECENLITLEGLQNLQTAEHQIAIHDNPTLENLDGLRGFDFIPEFGVGIYNNPMLSACAVSGICNLVLNYPDTINIQSNGVGCNTEAEVESTCLDCGVISYLYPDADGDGYGASNSLVTAFCQNDTMTTGFVNNNIDCDDDNANDVN